MNIWLRDIWDFRSSGLLRSVDWYLATNVLGWPIGPIFKRGPLNMGPIDRPETSVTNYQSTLRNSAEDWRPHTRTKAWNYAWETFLFATIFRPFWSLSRLLSKGYRSPSPKVNQPESKTDYSPSSNVVKNLSVVLSKTVWPPSEVCERTWKEPLSVGRGL
jgi:hypothetical protein